MKDSLIAIIIVGLSSALVFAFETYSVSLHDLHQVLAVLIIVILIFVNLFYRHITQTYGKWLLLFLTTLSVQLLIIASGRFYSPFFILIYVLAFGITLFFNLNISILFLAFSFWVIFGNAVFDENARSALQHDPTAAILYGISFLAIIPLAQLFAHKYKFKDKIMKMMTNQIEIEETIIEELNELIFVTDKEATILSVNDAVVQTLRRSKSELVNQSFF